ncbi:MULTISPECIES: hypothetical protein [unclassified Sporosarcina]|uniref:hypothetical protein n=1 Tax=unclassified Sporosarcina TaxID=2647733 RepID=UPI00203D9760|nr:MULTISPECIES: hypothetical protein [unclassified Sporosarcina]GKV65573.1 hypothetical protein NCCP2331_17260 [Sporosarcina sp. NCCP-2331]GLB55698.1 hypothetical protein NCCP2378_14850 [Sporosarcina sp. NCCP-2378]
MKQGDYMKRLEFGAWTIETDRERTREFYAGHPLLTQDCSCEDCLHYVQACEQFPAEIRDFFRFLGIDPHKEGEVSAFGRSGDGTHHYIVFYHFAGRIIDGPEQIETMPSYKLAGVDISFTEEADLVPEGFTSPVVQVELEMYLD